MQQTCSVAVKRLVRLVKKTTNCSFTYLPFTYFTRLSHKAT